MSSPSRPVDIGSPRQLYVFHSESPTPAGTPHLRAWRAQYTGTPPVPNIPARFTPGNSTSGSPSLNLPPSHPGLLGRHYLSPSDRISSARPSSSGTPGSSFDPGAVYLDNLLDEGKARVIRRHLLMPEERQNQGGFGSICGSEVDVPVPNDDVLSAGSSCSVRPPAEETETFPIPYEAPGADIT